MKQSMQSQDFSKIKTTKMSLKKESKTLKIRGYCCSKFFKSTNLLLQGEELNPQSETRNALLTAINMENGELIGRI